jgi:hypothetical protein
MDDLDIPILRRAYELYKTFHGLRSVVSKADRYTLWQRAENLILDIIESILLASHLSKSEKLPHLERVSAKLNVLRIFLRLTKDTKLLDLKKCLLLQEIVDEIGRMLGGWMKSIKEQNNSPSPGSLRERERERESSLGGEKELPGGPEEHVVVGIAVPVVDVHDTLVDVEFGAVAIREHYFARSHLIALGVEGYCLAAYVLSSLYFIREQRCDPYLR